VAISESLGLPSERLPLRKHGKVIILTTHRVLADHHKALDSLDVTPPKPPAENKKVLLVSGDIGKLLALLGNSVSDSLPLRLIEATETTASLLGLLGLTLSKVKLLEVTRQICERQTEKLDNGEPFVWYASQSSFLF
jgi:hypothetical protein